MFLYSSGENVHEKYSIRAQNETSVFKFLRRSVDRKCIWYVFRVKPPFSNSSAVVWTGLKLGLEMEFLEGGLHEADHLQAASA